MRVPVLALVISLLLALSHAQVPLTTRASGCWGPVGLEVLLEGEPETYELWSRELEANVSALRMLSPGERSLLIVALEGGGCWRLLGLETMNGNVLVETGTFGEDLGELLAIGGFLVVATNQSLLIFNSNLSLAHERSWPEGNVSKLQAIDNRTFIFVRGSEVVCFSLEDMDVRWSADLGSPECFCTCALPGQGIAVLRLEGGTWRGRFLTADGTGGPEVEMSWLSWARRVRATSLNSSHFLLTAGNDTYEELILVSAEGFSPIWSVRAWVSKHNGPFTLPDFDGDGVPEVLAWLPRRLCVLSGASGSELVELSGLDEVCSVAYTGDGLLAILSEEHIRLVQLDLRAGQARWLWEREATHACALPDLDGDGISELAVAEGQVLRCLWGSYDDRAPVVELVWPEDGLTTSFTTLTLAARVADNQSGVRSVVFKVDGAPVSCRFDSARGLYVAEVRLAEGEHVWHVEAEDRVGHRAPSRVRKLTINLSFFGGPGWLDDAAFFAPWAAVLIITSGLLLRGGRPRLNRPPGPRSSTRPWPSGAYRASSPPCSPSAASCLGHA